MNDVPFQMLCYWLLFLMLAIIASLCTGCGENGNVESVSNPNLSAVAVSARRDQTLALTVDGTVLGWGDSDIGIYASGVPAKVKALDSPAVAISTGEFHCLALMADGTVKAWGYNVFGQLGNGDNISSDSAVTVKGLDGKVVAVAAGGFHSMALMADGTVKAWGISTCNGAATNNNVPATVAGLGGTAVAIAAGTHNSMALMADGSIKTWGYNQSGQLGNGSTANSFAPVTVIGLARKAIAIAVGYAHSMALLEDGTVVTWGYNRTGVLGNGTNTDSSVPVSVSGLGGPATAIAAGDWHSMALMADGTVYTWGNNSSGQLGNGNTNDSNAPVSVAGLGADIQTISAGDAHSVALLTNGTVMVWGDNTYGQLGNGTSAPSLFPQPVLTN